MPKIVRSTDELITNNITGALLPASGNTGERPGVPVNGQLRYNTTTPGLEAYVDGSWSTLAAGSGLGSFVRRDGDTMVGTLTFTNTFQLILDETGTVSAPAMAFDGDLDTGIYQSAGNIVGITGQGANVALFDGSVATPVNYFTFSSSATGAALILSNAGTDTNGVGLGITVLGKAASAAGDGGPIVITGGLGDTAGVGGIINFTAGQGGATGIGGDASLTAGAGGGTSGAGGAVIVTGGAGTLGDSAGGIATTTGGAGQGTGAGGDATFAGGASGAGTTGTGGEAHVHGGASGATDGAGGQVHVHGGAGAGTGNGGLATLFGGASGATGTGGAATLIGGAGAAGGTAGSVTIDAGAPAGGSTGTILIGNVDATGLTLGQTTFPVTTTAIGILALTATDTLTAVNAATGGATIQFLQFNDTGDVFSWENRDSTFTGFSTVTDDASATISAEWQDDLLLGGATNGGITTVATDNPEVVTFSITPTDLATTGATIASADFMIVSDSADAITVVGQKVTFASAFDDMGVPYTSNTNQLTFTNTGTGVTPIIGNSGTDTNGIGLGLAFTAKTATTTGAGGLVTVTAGAGSGTGDGGATVINGGVGGATGDGGELTFTGGVGGATSGTGGALIFAGGAAGATVGIGGAVSFTGGAGTGASTGGEALFTGGVAGVTGIGGAASVTGGAGGATSGKGGNASLVGGAGAGTDAEGGDVYVTGGAASATNADGGDINITPGLLQGTGKDGAIRLVARSVPVITNVPVPGTGTDTEVLTEAEMFGGIFVQTPTAATTCTTPSGANISAGFATTPEIGDSFDFTIINLGGTTTWDITLAGGDGNVTFIGSVKLAPIVDELTETSSGTWRFRNTGASTWVGYRL